MRTESVGQSAAMNETRDYLANSLSHSFAQAAGSGKISDRHLETIVSKLTSKAMVTDTGSSSLVRGATINSNAADKWNAINAGPENTKRVAISQAQNIINKVAGQTYKDKSGAIIVEAGKMITAPMITRLVAAGYKNVYVYSAPIQYESKLIRYEDAGNAGSENWLSNLGTRGPKQQLARGAMFGQVDKLEDSRARTMTGKMLPVGEGFSKPKVLLNSIGTNIRNFFLKNK